MMQMLLCSRLIDSMALTRRLFGRYTRTYYNQFSQVPKRLMDNVHLSDQTSATRDLRREICDQRCAIRNVQPEMSDQISAITDLRSEMCAQKSAYTPAFRVSPTRTHVVSLSSSSWRKLVSDLRSGHYRYSRTTHAYINRI